MAALKDRDKPVVRSGKTGLARVFDKALFIGELAKMGNVSQACRVARVTRAVVTRLKSADPEFALAWEDAVEEAADALEAEAWRRAVSGYVEKRVTIKDTVPVISGQDQAEADARDGSSDPVLAERSETSVHKLNDRLLLVLLRANRPEKYNPRQAGPAQATLQEIAGDPDPPTIERGRVS